MVWANHSVPYQLNKKAVGASNTNGLFGDFPGTATAGDRRDRAYLHSRMVAKQNAYPGVNNMVQARGGWPLGKETPMSHPYKDRAGYILKFVRYITKNGKRIYPKSGKVFPIWVKA